MSLSRARVLVVACEASAARLVAALLRTGLQLVHSTSDVAAARRLCGAGEVDACLVVLPPEAPDEVPWLSAEAQAPGDGTGTPSLLLADVVTSYVATSAHQYGYAATAALHIPPRLLYRRIGGLLQQTRSNRTRPSGRSKRQARPLLVGRGGPLHAMLCNRVTLQ
jgi:hypothetical protein